MAFSPAQTHMLTTLTSSYKDNSEMNKLPKGQTLFRTKTRACYTLQRFSTVSVCLDDMMTSKRNAPIMLLRDIDPQKRSQQRHTFAADISVWLPTGGTLGWPRAGSSLLISSDPQPNWHRPPISAFCLKVNNMPGTELPTVRNSAAFQCFIHQGKNLFIACSTHFLFSF